ncbi:sedoheptulokinase [Echinococcus multilocularis]|uniref:Sedoheptulokinase n=1 Tax=Echinococcus multilocularis TaxID=6211 RepID=A0A068Y6V6_ECHMU|nr:sedoheptulokinase [Echinococcus multilocularis]
MESEVPLILGIDLGTSSIKVALVTQGPNPRVETSLSRDTGLVSGPSLSNLKIFYLPNEHTQDVGKIFQCLHILLSSIPSQLMTRVTAITVTGQMHGVMGWLGNNLAIVDKSKNEKKKLDVNVSGGGCGKLVTWMDRRCSREFLDSLPNPMRSEKPSTGFGCATILWHFKNQPDEFAMTPLNEEQERDIFEKTAVLRKTSVGSPTQRPAITDNMDTCNSFASQSKSRSVSQSPLPSLLRPIQHTPWTCIGTVADFLVACLASLQRPVISPQMAMSWGYFDVENNSWDFHALNASGFTLTHLLPEIVPCGTEVGKLAFDWEGVPAGASVFVALGDLQCSVYPFLEHQSTLNGIGACNISTSAQIAFKLPAGLEINGQTSSHSSSTDVCNRDSEGVFERLLKSKRISVWPFFHPNERIVVAASLNGGNVIERFIKMLRVWCRQLGCPAIETAQIYEKLSHAASGQIERKDSPKAAMMSSSEINVDPRLFGERYCEAVGVKDYEPVEPGASVTNIHPDDVFSLPAIYAAVCRGVVRNLVSMAPPELLVWANVKQLYCMGGALKRNPLLLHQLKSEYSLANVNCVSEDNVVEACVGAALFTATIVRKDSLASFPPLVK